MVLSVQVSPSFILYTTFCVNKSKMKLNYYILCLFCMYLYIYVAVIALEVFR